MSTVKQVNTQIRFSLATLSDDEGWTTFGVRVRADNGSRVKLVTRSGWVTRGHGSVSV